MIVPILTIITAWNLIFVSHSMRASTMKPTVDKITSAAIDELRITVVYDNNPYKEGLTTSWGFACVIRGAEKTILFDTGGTAPCCSTTCSSWELILKKYFVGDRGISSGGNAQGPIGRNYCQLQETGR